MKERDVASPCVNVCQLDPRTGLCRGCLRTLDEIAGWMDMSNEERRAVIARLEDRRKVLA